MLELLEQEQKGGDVMAKEEETEAKKESAIDVLRKDIIDILKRLDELEDKVEKLEGELW